MTTVAAFEENVNETAPTQIAGATLSAPPTASTTLCKRRQECEDDNDDSDDARADDGSVKSFAEVSVEVDKSEDSDYEVSSDSSLHAFFRKRVPKNTSRLVWKDINCQDENQEVYIYQDDLDILLPDGLATASILDYFIYRSMPRQYRLIYVCGIGMYLSMEVTKYTRQP